LIASSAWKVSAPPVLCVLWYGTMVYFPVRGLTFTFAGPIAFAISATA
jgi:hypothetical protein